MRYGLWLGSLVECACFEYPCHHSDGEIYGWIIKRRGERKGYYVYKCIPRNERRVVSFPTYEKAEAHALLLAATNPQWIGKLTIRVRPLSTGRSSTESALRAPRVIPT